MELTGFLAVIEQQIHQSGVAGVFSQGTWVLPFLTLVFQMSLALLWGSIVPMNLRLLGVWRSVPLYELKRVLVPCSIISFLLIACCGTLLISPSPGSVLYSKAFQVACSFIIVAWLNAVLLRFVPAWRYLDRVDSRGTIRRFRYAGGVSLICWSGVFVCYHMPTFVNDLW